MGLAFDAIGRVRGRRVALKVYASSTPSCSGLGPPRYRYGARASSPEDTRASPLSSREDRAPRSPWRRRRSPLFPRWHERRIAGSRRSSNETRASSHAAVFLRFLVLPLRRAQDVWCIDFKGHFTLGDGSRCDPLTLIDAASRYLLKREAVTDIREAGVRAELERAFREFGLPTKMRSDNGPPFASKALGGLSRLSVWWIQLGILPERIEPGKPQQNGRHERMHKTLKQHTASPPCGTRAEQQRAFDRFRRDYNDERPHEALGQTPPGAHYEPSPRAIPERLREPEYGDDFAVRRANSDGYFSFKREKLHVGAPLSNQPIGLRQTDEDEWELFYGPLLVGYMLVRDGKPRIQPVR